MRHTICLWIAVLACVLAGCSKLKPYKQDRTVILRDDFSSNGNWVFETLYQSEGGDSTFSGINNGELQLFTTGAGVTRATVSLDFASIVDQDLDNLCIDVKINNEGFGTYTGEGYYGLTQLSLSYKTYTILTNKTPDFEDEVITFCLNLKKKDPKVESFDDEGEQQNSWAILNEVSADEYVIRFHSEHGGTAKTTNLRVDYIELYTLD